MISRVASYLEMKPGVPQLCLRADHIYSNSIATNKNPRKRVQVIVFS